MMKEEKKYKVREEKEGLDYGSLDENTVKHSKYYHAYFEGYEERIVRNAISGKNQIERIYVGDYMERKGRLKQPVFLKTLYLFLCAAGLVLFLYGGAQPLSVSRYVYLPGSVFLLCFVFLLWTLITMLSMPARLTFGQYHLGSRRLLKLSAAAAICTMLQTVTVMVAVERPMSAAARCSAGCNALSALVFFALFLLEKTAHYEVIPNQNGHPEV